jgi:UrcA family protein
MLAANSNGGHRYRSGLVAGLMGLMVLAAAQAPAATFDSGVVVKYADLDINTAAGAEQLYARIRQAATEVCPQVSFIEISRYLASQRCQEEVVAHAVGSIGNPQLAAVHASRTHHGAHSPV